MFDGAGIETLVHKHKKTLQQLREIEDHLNLRFADMENPIRAVVLAIASGEALLLVGPPGTAKSRLIRAVCQCLGLLDEEMHVTKAKRKNGESQQYFEYLLTPFTEPSELFGYFDLAQAMAGGQLERIEDGMMQHATVVFLDEVFNASSAILNSLLTFMNERRFHDRGVTREVALRCLFSATNRVPSTPELRAVFDRFLLRVWIDNEPDEPARLQKLLQYGWRETHAPIEAPQLPNLLNAMERFRGDIESMSRDGKLSLDEKSNDYAKLAGQVRQLRQEGLSDVSNRRIVKFMRIMLIHRVYRSANGKGTTKLEPDDRLLLLRYGADADTTRRVAEIRRRDLSKY